MCWLSWVASFLAKNEKSELIPIQSLYCWYEAVSSTFYILQKSGCVDVFMEKQKTEDYKYVMKSMDVCCSKWPLLYLETFHTPQGRMETCFFVESLLETWIVNSRLQRDFKKKLCQLESIQLALLGLVCLVGALCLIEHSLESTLLYPHSL